MNQLTVPSELMGCHEYQMLWNPIIGEVLETRREPDNINDAFAVSVLKGGQVIGHLKKGENGRYARTIFYFLRADPSNRCTASVTGMPVNHGDGMGMKVPCVLTFHGHPRFIGILEREL